MRIAVVDADPTISTILTELLEAEGHGVVTYTHAAGTAMRLAQDPPDVILLDPWLDHRDSGWEVLAQLQATPATSSIPVILCTGIETQTVSGRSLHATGLPIVLKPFDLEELLEAVQQSGAIAQYGIVQ